MVLGISEYIPLAFVFLPQIEENESPKLYAFVWLMCAAVSV